MGSPAGAAREVAPRDPVAARVVVAITTVSKSNALRSFTRVLLGINPTLGSKPNSSCTFNMLKSRGGPFSDSFSDRVTRRGVLRSRDDCHLRCRRDRPVNVERANRYSVRLSLR